MQRAHVAWLFGIGLAGVVAFSAGRWSVPTPAPVVVKAQRPAPTTAPWREALELSRATGRWWGRAAGP